MTTTVLHVILDQPLRCFAQMMTASRLAEASGATMHLTPGGYGEPTRKRPGMGSGCMPLDPARGADRCRHDLAALRREGAIDITADTRCWTPDGSACPTCAEVPAGEMAVPDEYPVPGPGHGGRMQGALW
jgi:hypothetical protein